MLLFGFAIRSVYIESCGMFVRGGVYVVVRDSMGPFMAKLSVSALVFDYRGFGRSEGKPTEAGVLADARAACEKVRSGIGRRSSKLKENRVSPLE